MKVVITGGAGFLGILLARRLLGLADMSGPGGNRLPIDEVVLFDMVAPDRRPAGLDERVIFKAGEISDKAMIDRLIDQPDIAVFHLASVVSGGGEADFDLAIRVNLMGHLNVLEAARALGSRPRVVFVSSIAVFGGSSMPETVGDATKQLPQTTYGMTKAVGELLVDDYSRKGFIDGRSARLPTVIVRPGKANKAASSFASGVFREPLNGVECLLPVGLDTVMPVAGYRTVIEGFLRLYEADARALGDDRAINFPAIAVSVAAMIEALKRVAKDRKLGPIREERDPIIERIVATWPIASRFDRAVALGLPQDPDIDSIVRAYIADFLPGQPTEGAQGSVYRPE
jgi:nucleoside-diphosphate-sugar epimerase